MPLKYKQLFRPFHTLKHKRVARHGNLKLKPLFLAFIILASSVAALPLLGSTSVSAVTTSASKTSNDFAWQTKSLLYYRAIAECMKESNLSKQTTLTNTITHSDALAGKWFTGSVPLYQTVVTSTALGVYMRDATSGDSMDVGADGYVNCDNTSLIKSALSHWGLDAVEVLCNSGFRRVDLGVSQTIATCLQTSNEFERRDGGKANNVEKFTAYIRSQVYDGKEPDLTGPQWYIYYRHSLSQSCITGLDSKKPTSTTYGNDNEYGYNNVQWVDTSEANKPEIITGGYIGTWQTSNNVVLRTGPGSGYNSFERSCAQTVGLMNNYATAFKTWATTAPPELTDSLNTGVVAGETSENATSCKPEGIGWIICPISNFIAGMTDGLFNVVSELMKVEPILGSGEPQQNLYNAWSTMRNIANIAFVIAFLIIIFSQLTNVGVTNYGVKKLLPKLVIAAILVNVSFYICAIALDLSNIIGIGTQNILMELRNSAVGEGLAGDPNATSDTWAALTAAILSGGVIGGSAWAAILISGTTTTGAAVGALLIAMIPALLAIATAFLVLILRQALIFILIIISPLAFVAYLLPNTESWYKKWQSTFLALLIFFPLMSLVFGGSQLASSFIMATADKGSFVGLFTYIGGLAVQVIPLFLAPVLIKLSSGVLNRFAGIVNNPNKGLVDKGRKAAQGAIDLSNKRGMASNNKFGRATRAFSNFKNQREMKGRQYDAAIDANWNERVAGNETLTGINNETIAQSSRGGEAKKVQQKEYLNALATDDSSTLATAAGIGGEPATSRILAAVQAEEKNETKKAIENAKLTANISAGDIDTMASKFKAAVAKNDSIEARAMQDLMLTSGSAGISKYRGALTEIENDTNTAGESVLKSSAMSDVRKNMLESHGARKADAADLIKQAVTGDKMTTVSNSPDTWIMSDNDIVHQKTASIEFAVKSGGIGREQATRIITNEDLAGSLDPTARKEIQRIAGTVTSPVPGYDQRKDGLYIPREK